MKILVTFLSPILGFLLVACSCGDLEGLDDHDGNREDMPPDDTVGESTDAGSDISTDSLPDIDEDHDLDSDVSSDGIIIPEGTPQPYPTDTGIIVQRLPRCDGSDCVAFSGEVYGLLLMEESTWSEDVEYAGIYRLAPGGTYLGTTWVDRLDSDPASLEICWTGEAFVATFLVRETIIRIVSVDESGALVRPPVDLISERHGPGHVFCPDEGPFIVEHLFGESIPTKIYEMDKSGELTGLYSEVTLPDLEGYHCTETESEAACMRSTEPGIAFFNKEGNIRFSDLLTTDFECRYGCSLVRTDGGVGAAWINDTESGKRYLMYAMFDMEGAIAVPPVQVIQAEDNARAGSSGSTVFVSIALGQWPDRMVPNVILLDLEGNVLDGPVSVPDTSEFNPVLGVFWEGDAYGVIWQNGTEDLVYYQRFLINL
jgi:hypothetical protein